MSINDSLGDRMKRYENVTRNHLMRRNPIIIRIDGKAFHQFTRGFDRPYDDILVMSMCDTLQYLCENIQGVVFGYTQSDEISLVLCDYKKITSCAWFDNNIQKIASVSASMATMAFNKAFMYKTELYAETYPNNTKMIETYRSRIQSAVFDSRVFSIPKDEVNNYFLWRQKDATRNSIQMMAQANYSHKELHGLSCNKLQDKLMEKGINWNDIIVPFKRGVGCVKKMMDIKTENGSAQRPKWVIDGNIPIFSKDTEYINNRIVFTDEEE